MPKLARHHKTKKLILFERTLGVILILLAIAGALFARGLIIEARKTADAKKALADAIGGRAVRDNYLSIRSLYGFTTAFDSTVFNAYGFNHDGQQTGANEQLSALTDTALVEIGPLPSEHEFSQLAIETSSQKDFLAAQRKVYGNLSDEELAYRFYTKDDPSSSLVKNLVAKTETALGGYQYLRAEFNVTPKDAATAKALGFTKSVFYITVQNARPYSFRIDYPAYSKYYGAYIDTITRTSYQAVADAILTAQGRGADAPPLPLLGLGIVEAASVTTSVGQLSDNDIKVVAYNVPSVVKVGALYCADFNLVNASLSVPLGKTLCAGSTGSGFFVSSDGYIATNGHVAVMTAADALSTAVAAKDAAAIKAAVAAVLGAGYSDKTVTSVAQGVLGDPNKLEQLYNIVVNMGSSSFHINSDSSTFAVQLGHDPLQFTFDGTPKSHFDLGASIVAAQRAGYDFAPDDFIRFAAGQGFTASDVALLKVDGSNYPVTTAGSVTGLPDKEPLTVIGFPGLLDDRDIKETGKSTAIVTKGMVLSLKKVPGNQKVLIESDVSIDHGSSGGPALDSKGRVIGLATYELTDMNGLTLRYMRNIADLLDLAARQKITLKTSSQTQSLWEDALNKFVSTKYRSALPEFTKVAQLYPAHSLASEFVALSQQKITAGLDTTYSYVPALGGGIALLIIAFIVIYVLRHRHRKDVLALAMVAPAAGLPHPELSAVPVKAASSAASFGQPIVLPGAVIRPKKPAAVPAAATSAAKSVPDRAMLAAELTTLGADVQFMVKHGHRNLDRYREITRSFKGVLDAVGWPTPGKVGDMGSKYAWLIAQHADFDPIFQAYCLAVAKQVPARELDRVSFAFLADRVLVGSGKPQLYGTQFYRNPSGELTARPLSRPRELGRLRAQMGLPPFAEYIKQMRAHFGR